MALLKVMERFSLTDTLVVPSAGLRPMMEGGVTVRGRQNDFYESVDRLRSFRAAHFTSGAMAVFLLSAAVKEALARFSAWAGRKVNAQSLIADAWHHRSDAVASALIVVGATAAAQSGGWTAAWASPSRC